MTLAWEPLDTLLRDGMEDLAVEHWREVALDRDMVPLAPDWDHYRKLEKIGGFKIAALRARGVLAGYNAFFVNRHMHYAHTLHAVNDYIYLAPEHRKAWTGVRLIRGTEAMLQNLGVVKVLYHAKLHVKIGKRGGTLGDLLNLLGYRQIETVHSKILGA